MDRDRSVTCRLQAGHQSLSSTFRFWKAPGFKMWPMRRALEALISLLVLSSEATAARNDKTREGILAALAGRIKHVIVLMEENRSFDHCTFPVLPLFLAVSIVQMHAVINQTGDAPSRLSTIISLWMGGRPFGSRRPHGQRVQLFRHNGPF